MKLRQGTFSFLPDLTDAEIHTQVQYCIDNGLLDRKPKIYSIL